MVQGTTPTYQLCVKGYDLTDKTVYVTVSSGRTLVTKTNPDIHVEYNGENSIISFMLTQEETLGFEVGNAKVQVRFIDSSGHALATNEGQVKVRNVLLKKVIEFNGG